MSLILHWYSDISAETLCSSAADISVWTVFLADHRSVGFKLSLHLLFQVSSVKLFITELRSYLDIFFSKYSDIVLQDSVVLVYIFAENVIIRCHDTSASYRVVIYPSIPRSVSDPPRLSGCSPQRAAGRSVLHFKSLPSLQTSFYVLKRSFLKRRLLLWASETPGKLWAPVWVEGNEAARMCFTSSMLNCTGVVKLSSSERSITPSSLSPLWHHCDGLKLQRDVC